MKPTTRAFKRNVRVALHDPRLQKALGNVSHGFIEKRRKALDRLAEYEALRESARTIKDHTLDHLDQYLLRFEKQVVERANAPPLINNQQALSVSFLSPHK